MNKIVPLSLTLFLAGMVAAWAAPTKEKSARTTAAGAAYQWNEEPKTPESGAWIAHFAMEAEAQNRPEVSKSLSEMMRAGNLTIPCAESGLYFFTKREGKEKQPSIYLRKGLSGKDERLVDAAKVGRNAALRIADVSNDGSLLVYVVREGKRAEGSVRFFDVNARREWPDVLPRANYNTVSISPGRKGVYYTKVEPAGTRVFLHSFGSAPAADTFIFGETYNYEPLGPNDLISAEVTDDEGYLILSVARGMSAKRTDFFAQELARPDEKVRPIINHTEGTFTAVSHATDLYLLTDNEAPKKRVVKLMIDDPHPTRWGTIVPEGKSVLSDLSIVGEKLFVSGPEASGVKTRIVTLEGKETGHITHQAVGAPKNVHHKCPRR